MTTEPSGSDALHNASLPVFRAALISNVLIVVVLLLWITAGHVVYFGTTQRRTGQSAGKRIAGIRVVDRMGCPPTPRALWLRSLPLLVEYMYLVAWMTMMGSPYRQRLGDRWAHTYVIAN